MSKRDFYQVLGVSKTASADEIKKAHRKLVRQYHPDANKGNPGAEAKFKEAQEAYDILSDPEKRAKYDQFGHAAFQQNAPPPGGDPFAGFRRAGRGGGGGGGGGGPDVEFDFGGGGGMGDIFEQLFGGGARRGRRGRAPQGPPPNADLEHTVALSFIQAAKGANLPLQISRGDQVETIDIKIPPGVKDGSRIRVRGKGNQYPGGAGDLYIITKVEPHPFFKRDNLDILLETSISMYEALLGTKITVPTLDGEVTLTIPPGTSSHAKLRIRGKGVERQGEHGDQLVILKIVVPKNLDEEDKELIRKLEKKYPVNPRE